MSTLNDDLCDVTFIVENTEIEAHRQILSISSPVFAKQLLGSFREAQNRNEPILVEDVTALAFKVIPMLRLSFAF